MKIEYDPVKDEINQLKHGISLAAARDIDLDDAAAILTDSRNGEKRFIAYVPVEGRLHAVWYTWRGDVCCPGDRNA